MLCFGILVMYCQLQQPAPAANAYCEIAKPIYWKATWPRDAKEQADRENRKYKKLCSKKLS